jgi:type I restriction enzyme M protein
MLDARNIYRKVTRKIYDFSPEQLANLTAIVWLYRGQKDRFLGLVKDYLSNVCIEAAAIPGELDRFETALVELRGQLSGFADSIKNLEAILPEQQAALGDALMELVEAEAAYNVDRASLVEGLTNFRRLYETSPPTVNLDQHSASQTFAPLAGKAKGLVKQIDLLYKLAARCVQLAQETATVEAAAEFHDRRLAGKRLKQLEETRKHAVEQLKLAAYFHRQIVWLQEHFPNAEMCAVPGLCKVVNFADIEAADWSLTPGRFVGVAPVEVDEDFDFEQTIQDIHIELKGLNAEAVELAARIEQNFSELF